MRRWILSHAIFMFIVGQSPLLGAWPLTPGASAQPSADLEIRNQLSAYYASRCVVPYPTSIEYWVTQWHNWGNRDPEYFWRRVALADEFTTHPPPPPCPITAPPPSPAPDTTDLHLLGLQIAELSAQLAQEAELAQADRTRLEEELLQTRHSLEEHRQASRDALEQGKGFLRSLTKYLPYVLTALGVVSAVK